MMKNLCFSLSLSLLFVLLYIPLCLAATQSIRIGFNLPLSGWLEEVGLHAKNAAELVARDINKAGGLKVGDTLYKVEFLYGDNTSNASGASSLAVKLISSDMVLAIVGPLSSQHAVPAGQMANAFATPMIAPWSTSPLTTKNRPYVFRSGYVLDIQGPVLTKFIAKEFKVKKAAVLFDIVSAYPRAVARNFKEAFEAENGVGSIVAYEEFRTGETDFRPQLKRIQKSGAGVLLTPQHYNEVPSIVRQAKEVGVTIPIIGANSWAGGDLLGECGQDCKGLYFVANYAPGGAQGLNKKFVDAYKAAYGDLPDEPAALTWDAVRAVLQAVKDSEGLTGDLMNDRIKVRQKLADLKDFDGASGVMTFNESGDPEKCAVMVRIDDDGYSAHDMVCP